MSRTLQERGALKDLAHQVFSPRAPISTAELFAGRSGQIQTTLSAIKQPGAHAIIYGERGVGKTSLAIICPLLLEIQASEVTTHPGLPIIAPRVSCDSTDDFPALWAKVFERLRINKPTEGMGLNPAKGVTTTTLRESIGDQKITPDLVGRTLADYARLCRLVIIVDEFDRLPDGSVTRLMADMIKSLADTINPVTLLIVGVGDSVATLVRGHESVRRHLVEVPVPRMSANETAKIINDRIVKLRQTIDPLAMSLVQLLARGLPFYTHLLGQHSACACVDEDKDVISQVHVLDAVRESIRDSEREVQRAYYDATTSRQPTSLYAHTLAACALAPKDEFGYFPAASVRGPMTVIMGQDYKINKFMTHLERFAEKPIGILQAVGVKHQRRFRFAEPLMESFVMMRSLQDEVFTIQHLLQLTQPAALPGR